MNEMNLKEIGKRIREMREISGRSVAEMAKVADITEAEFTALEEGRLDPPFTVLHRCAVALNVDVMALVEGHTAKLSGHIITRKGEGLTVTDEQGIRLQNMAAMFKDRLATPYYVTYQYDASAQDKPIHLTTHAGQEFDLVLEGTIKLQIGNHVEILHEGDSAFYQSSNPHGMLALDGKPAKFLAMIMAEHEKDTKLGLEVEYARSGQEAASPVAGTESTGAAASSPRLIAQRFIAAEIAPEGHLEHIKFGDLSAFNFAYDIVDQIAAAYPTKLAMVHVANDFSERRLTFRDIADESNRVANYLTSLGIGRGDKVMLVLKRHWQFWPIILAIHKIGAVVIPATSQLVTHDFTYRIKAAEVKALFITADGDVTKYADEAICELFGSGQEAASPVAGTESTGAAASSPRLIKVTVNGKKDGWRSFEEEVKAFPTTWAWDEKNGKRPGGSDPMLMFFTSGTTGYPKMALHSYKYPFGHYVTAKYWHQVERDGLHFTISETGWAKAMWGKLYGQWLCEAAIFVYDFDRFHADQVLPMFAKYGITTFCAPPTMYRMLIKEDISKYDFSSVHHATTAGEALNPEVFIQFKKSTGLEIFEGFGQTETTCALGNLFGDALKPGSMGRPIPDYDIDLVDEDGNSVPAGEHGEIVVRTPRSNPHPGIFIGYYKDEEKTAEAWRHGMYHTCDLAWKDEDDYYHYVGRADDVIKSSGYRIGPFEIENVIMELPYVVECGVSAAPDPIRGQVVKATIKLVKGKEGTEELKKEIQDYVKAHTAPYKYPRIVVFRDELPKTVSGKIQRNKL